jgi:hypothetical protein
METAMNNHLSNIIDSIIRSHVTKVNGEYYCESQDMSEHDIKNLVSTLFNFDTHFKEIVKDYIDDLIQSRILYVQHQEYREKGLRPVIDNINGEVTWAA